MVAEIGNSGDAAERASELRNLLQIIGGTTALLENIWSSRDDSGKYLEMLRTSVDRAAHLTMGLVEAAGGVGTDVIIPEEVAPSSPHTLNVKPRVMVVDDEPMMRTVFEELLAQSDYDVITAASGCEALDILRRDPDICDVVVLDFAMPFMRGDEAFRRIRAICPALPVVLATGFIDRGTLESLRDEGLTAFINKPIAPEELIEATARALGENAERSTPRGTAAAS